MRPLTKLVRCVFVVGMLGLALVPDSFAESSGIDTYGSECVWAYEGAEPVTLLASPAGTGNPFTQAQTISGATVDVTIYLYLYDLADQPIVGFATEDMWLEWPAGDFDACAGGTTPDYHTDENGMTQWSLPPRGAVTAVSCAMSWSTVPR